MEAPHDAVQCFVLIEVTHDVLLKQLISVTPVADPKWQDARLV